MEHGAKPANARGGTSIHPLVAADAPVAASMRAAMLPNNGKSQDLAERRKQFDGMMAATPWPASLRSEAGTVGGMPSWWCRPTSSQAGAVLLYLHGGGYAQGQAASFRGLAGHLAPQGGTDAFIPDYRLAPEHPFPAAFEDVAAAYRALAEGQADRITVAGEFAGGGLALALLSLLATDASLAQPRGAAVLSPLTDLAVTGGRVETCAEADPLFTRDTITAPTAQYLQGQNPANPQASPLYARLA